MVGFAPAEYNVTEDDGEVVLSLQIISPSGSLECDLEATINLIDGTRASKK